MRVQRRAAWRGPCLARDVTRECVRWNAWLGAWPPRCWCSCYLGPVASTQSPFCGQARQVQSLLRVPQRNSTVYFIEGRKHHDLRHSLVGSSIGRNGGGAVLPGSSTTPVTLPIESVVTSYFTIARKSRSFASDLGSGLHAVMTMSVIGSEGPATARACAVSSAMIATTRGGRCTDTFDTSLPVLPRAPTRIGQVCVFAGTALAHVRHLPLLTVLRTGPPNRLTWLCSETCLGNPLMAAKLRSPPQRNAVAQLDFLPRRNGDVELQRLLIDLLPWEAR